MLYVVAWPLLSEADDTALRRLRTQYHPTEAGEEARLRAALDAVRRRPFWFMIEHIARVDLSLYAEPADGVAELTELYDALNPMPGEEPFQPHITLGRFEAAAEAEQVARTVGRLHLPIRGRVEELALLRRAGDRLETLKTVRLGR